MRRRHHLSGASYRLELRCFRRPSARRAFRFDASLQVVAGLVEARAVSRRRQMGRKNGAGCLCRLSTYGPLPSPLRSIAIDGIGSRRVHLRGKKTRSETSASPRCFILHGRLRLPLHPFRLRLSALSRAFNIDYDDLNRCQGTRETTLSLWSRGTRDEFQPTPDATDS